MQKDRIYRGSLNIPDILLTQYPVLYMLFIPTMLLTVNFNENEMSILVLNSVVCCCVGANKMPLNKTYMASPVKRET